jgi:hypothetical protein
MEVSLQEHFEALLLAQEALHRHDIIALERQIANLRELVDAKQQSLALAVEKQESAYNIRFEGVNEWRQTFGDIANKGVPQDMFNARYDEITRRLNVIEQQLANMVGKTLGYSAGVGAVVLIIAIVTQLLNLGG